jgi:hypothetical protein
LLAGVGGAFAALAAQALARPFPARAEGEVVHVGGEYSDAISLTLLKNRANNHPVLVAQSVGSGTALIGSSGSGTGLAVESGSANALSARSNGNKDTSAVFAYNTFGDGVTAGSKSGTAVRAGAEIGYALHTEGRLKFQQASGVATIAAGRASTTVFPFPFAAFAANAFVLLTPRVNLRGRDLWYTTNPGASTFSIHLSAARSSPTTVAWLLVG